MFSFPLTILPSCNTVFLSVIGLLPISFNKKILKIKSGTRLKGTQLIFSIYMFRTITHIFYSTTCTCMNKKFSHTSINQYYWAISQTCVLNKLTTTIKSFSAFIGRIVSTPTMRLFICYQIPNIYCVIQKLVGNDKYLSFFRKVHPTYMNRKWPHRCLYPRGFEWLPVLLTLTKSNTFIFVLKVGFMDFYSKRAFERS